MLPRPMSIIPLTGSSNRPQNKNMCWIQDWIRDWQQQTNQKFTNDARNKPFLDRYYAEMFPHMGPNLHRHCFPCPDISNNCNYNLEDLCLKTEQVVNKLSKVAEDGIYFACGRLLYFLANLESTRIPHLEMHSCVTPCWMAEQLRKTIGLGVEAMVYIGSNIKTRSNVYATLFNRTVVSYESSTARLHRI